MAQSALFERLTDLTRGSEALFKALFTGYWIQEVGSLQRVGSDDRWENADRFSVGPLRSSSSMPDFSTITERAGDPVPQWQIDQMHHRYAWAAQFCRGKDVIEVACGTGQGLGLLNGVAASVHEMRGLGFDQSLPFREGLIARMLMLAMNHFLSDDDAAYVSETVRAFYSSRSTRE